jgi:hypothetical protein
MSGLIKHHLGRAALHMKHHADKNRTEQEFNVGDLFFLKLQPYIQSLWMPLRANQKLASKYFGSFCVTQKVGKIAYKLDLPAASKIQPVFHISQSKKVVGANVQVSPTLPLDSVAFKVPEKILQ